MQNGLVDNTPRNPTKIERLDSASNVILIDNYDSFTWNIYQYLVLEGATVKVYRNDQITLEALIAEKPTQLVISPGPGHPDTDSGISKAAIKEFSGKIPVFGVCMGHQCLISVFGGKVDVAGEILHGKTSVLKHDGKGTYSTLPDSLEVSSSTNLKQGAKPIVIMGCRHKEFTTEGVQFHPESILTSHGRTMFRNFLKLRGGTWKAYGSCTPI